MAKFTIPGFFKRSPDAAQREAQGRASHATFCEHYPGLEEEALERRLASSLRLAAEGVPLCDWLPVIETAAQVQRPDTKVVLDRARALVAVALKGEGLEPEFLDPFVEEQELRELFTPVERAVMDTAEPDRNTTVQMSWRYEAAHALFWALGFVDTLGPPTTPCDPGEHVRRLRDSSRDDLLEQANLREVSHILDETDLIYRYRWALTQAQLDGVPPPAGLHPGVALERQWALNWLIRHHENPWDETGLDT